MLMGQALPNPLAWWFMIQTTLRWLTLLTLIMSMILGVLLAALLFFFDTPVGIDFAAYYTAGRLLNAQQSLYDAAAASQIAAELQAAGVKVVSVYLYPPPLAVFFRPLALLPFWWAYGLWTVWSLALYVWLAWRIAQLAPPDQVWSGRLLGLAVLCFSGVALSVAGGQVNPLLAVLILAAYRLSWPSPQAAWHEWLAGALLALATLLKLSPILLLLPAILGRRWRIVGGWLGMVALLGAFGLALAGGWRAWPEYLRYSREAIPPFYDPTNQSLEAFWGRFFVGASYLTAGTNRTLAPVLDAAAPVRLIAMLCAALMVIVTLLRHARDPARAYLALLVVVVIGLPLGWNQTHLLVLLPMAVLAAFGLREARWPMLALLAGAYALYQAQRYVQALGWPALWQSAGLYAALIVWLMLIGWQARGARPR
jgi:hypothetical protein